MGFQTIAFLQITLICCLFVATSTGNPSMDDIIVIDTKAGSDDAMGMIDFFKAFLSNISPDIHAITCVFGPQPLKTVLINVARILCNFQRPDIPFYAGASQPLVPPFKEVIDINGSDGLGDVPYDPSVLPEPQPEDAVLVLLKLSKQYPGRLVIFCFGPLTNIAAALILDPYFLTRVKMLYIAGGTIFGSGNILPGRELNAYLDPFAFDKVLFYSSPDKVLLVPWDLAKGVGIELCDFNTYFNFPGNIYFEFGSQILRLLRGKEPMNAFVQSFAAMVYLFPSLIIKKEAGYLQISITCDARGVLLFQSVSDGASVEDINITAVLVFDRDQFIQYLIQLANCNV